MDDLEVTEENSHVVPYERGLSLRSIVRGTLGRFLPAATAIAGSFGLWAGLHQAPGHWLTMLGVLGLEVAGITAGFGVGLGALRRWLYPDARVDGRRSVVAGLCTPFALAIISVFAQGVDLAKIGGLSLVAGVVMAVLMYFAWLTPTPEDKRETPEAYLTSAS